MESEKSLYIPKGCVKRIMKLNEEVNYCTILDILYILYFILYILYSIIIIFYCTTINYIGICYKWRCSTSDK